MCNSGRLTSLAFSNGLWEIFFKLGNCYFDASLDEQNSLSHCSIHIRNGKTWCSLAAFLIEALSLLFYAVHLTTAGKYFSYDSFVCTEWARGTEWYALLFCKSAAVIASVHCIDTEKKPFFQSVFLPKWRHCYIFIQKIATFYWAFGRLRPLTKSCNSCRVISMRLRWQRRCKVRIVVSVAITVFVVNFIHRKTLCLQISESIRIGRLPACSTGWNVES